MATFSDLKEHLEKGGKIRRPCWREGDYIYLDDDYDDSIIDEDKCYFCDKQLLSDDWEVYEEPKIVINVQKTTVYKTRDGRKAFIGGLRYGIAWGLIENNTSTTMWNIKTGKVSSDEESDVDIVSEWED